MPALYLIAVLLYLPIGASLRLVRGLSSFVNDYIILVIYIYSRRKVGYQRNFLKASVTLIPCATASLALSSIVVSLGISSSI